MLKEGSFTLKWVYYVQKWVNGVSTADIQIPCVCASSAPPCACATGTAVVLEEGSCERMLLVLEECSRHSSGPWRMLKMSPRNPRNASWGISRQPVAGFTSALCLCRELAQGYWAQPSAERQVMSAPNISSWMQLLPWVARFFLPRLPAEFCRLRSSSCKECVASEQLGYVLGDCSALRPAQKGAWLLTNHRKPRTSTTSPAPRGKVQTHISVDRRQQCRHGIWSPGWPGRHRRRSCWARTVVDRRRRRSCWAQTRSSTDASCRRTAHCGCRARAPAFTDRISVQQKFTHRSAAQSVLLACLCARASVNFPPAQIHRSLTSATLRFCNDGVDSASRSRAQRSCRPQPFFLFSNIWRFQTLFFSRPVIQMKWIHQMQIQHAVFVDSIQHAILHSTCCICGQHSTCYNCALHWTCCICQMYVWTCYAHSTCCFQSVMSCIQHAVLVEWIQHAIFVYSIQHAVFVEHAMFNAKHSLNMLCSMQNRWIYHVEMVVMNIACWNAVQHQTNTNLLCCQHQLLTGHCRRYEASMTMAPGMYRNRRAS